MNKSKNTINKHSIYIFCSEDIKGNELVDQIGYGIEEEGIPFKVDYKKETSPDNLAYTAAQQSKLGIGIGIDSNNRVVLQMEKLSRDNPVFNKRIEDYFQAKLMGINAARLEKKIPFKEFDLKED
jgi:hypothetical protein